jgi:hypothetical protein
LPVIGDADNRHHPAPAGTMLQMVQVALRPVGIATWRHCDLAALPVPRDEALRPEGIAAMR